VIAAFNWAATGKVIAENSLAKIEKPGAASRGAESLLGTNATEIEATHARILAVFPPHWKPFLQALKDTGARPSELCAATAADFDEKLGAFVFRKEMSRRSDRFATRPQAPRPGDRTHRSDAGDGEGVGRTVPYRSAVPAQEWEGFARVNVVDRFIKFRRRLKLLGLTAYSYRHTWATELLQGRDGRRYSRRAHGKQCRRDPSTLLAPARGPAGAP